MKSNDSLFTMVLFYTKQECRKQRYGTLVGECTIYSVQTDRKVSLYLQTKQKFKDLSQFSGTKTKCCIIHMLILRGPA